MAHYPKDIFKAYDVGIVGKTPTPEIVDDYAIP